MTVCICGNITKEHIEEMVNDGQSDWKEASAASGAGHHCGSCRNHFRKVFVAAKRRRDRRKSD